MPFEYPKCCTPQRLSIYDALAAEVVSPPMYVALPAGVQDRIAAAVRKALR